MTSNTQTSNMLASVNEFVALYMVEAAKEIGGKAHGVLTKLWESKQGELALLFAAKPKKKRKRKSSGKKRGKSAYMFFCAEERLKIKEELPGLKGREVMCELGRRWKRAKLGDTSRWVDLAKEDKERVQSESESEPAPEVKTEDKVKTGDKAEVKTKSSPKKGPTRARSAYIFFCKEMRPKVKEELGSESNNQEIVSQLGKRWKIFKTDGDISKWNKLAKEDKTRYETAKALLVAPPPKAKTKAKAKAKAKAKTKAKAKAKAKTKKRIYAYAFWAKMHRAEISLSTGLKAKSLTTELREQWNALDKTEKAEWKEAAAAAAAEE